MFQYSLITFETVIFLLFAAYTIGSQCSSVDHDPSWVTSKFIWVTCVLSKKGSGCFAVDGILPMEVIVPSPFMCV